MQEINDITEFEQLYGNTKGFFKMYICSESVIEYYIESRDVVNMNIDAFWNISIYQRLSEPFIDKYSYYMDWWNICKYQILSERFIEEHIEDIMWFPLCKYANFNIDFFIKYREHIVWQALLQNEFICITKELIECNIYSFNLYDLIVEDDIPTNTKIILNELKDKYQYKYEIDKLQYNLNK